MIYSAKEHKYRVQNYFEVFLNIKHNMYTIQFLTYKITKTFIYRKNRSWYYEVSKHH